MPPKAVPGAALRGYLPQITPDAATQAYLNANYGGQLPLVDGIPIPMIAYRPKIGQITLFGQPVRGPPALEAGKAFVRSTITPAGIPIGEGRRENYESWLGMERWPLHGGGACIKCTRASGKGPYTCK